MGRCARVSFTSREGEVQLNEFRHVRTKQEPVQPIPKFTEVLDLLLAPGHEHVKLNVSCDELSLRQS